MRINFAKFCSDAGKECEIDIKNLTSEKIEEIKGQGVDLIQTKYFLKKDAYAIMVSRDTKRMLFCNTNER